MIVLDAISVGKAINARKVRAAEASRFRGVSIDSRTIERGNLFVAIKGASFDGHDFLNEAISKGAAGVVVESGYSRKISDGCASFEVIDTLRALGDLAHFWRRQFQPLPCIGMTGSNGKSTTKEMVASVLSSMGGILKTEGNFNNLIGLPLTLFRLGPTHRAAILEMGMSAPHEIERLAEIAEPSVGVVTTIQAVHLEQLGSIENVARAKAELFEGIRPGGAIVVNCDDDHIRPFAQAFPGRKITFGIRDGADIQFGRMQSDGLSYTRMTFYLLGRECELTLPLPGAHNVMNALAAAAVGVLFDIPDGAIIEGLEAFKPMKSRMQRMQLANGVQVIDDCYNANLQSMMAAIKTVSTAKRAGRFLMVVGDMLELGEQSDKFHYQLGQAAASHKVDYLFAFGDFSQDVVRGAQKQGLSEARAFDDIQELAEFLHHHIQTGDIVLIKGSRGMKMERVIEYLKYKVGV